MEVQPPWASELLARNRKVARNICWSTSLDSSSGINDSGRDVVIFAAATRTHSYDTSSNSSITRGKGTMVKRGIATYSMARDGGKVVDPVGVSSSCTYNRTEKSSILEEVAAVTASDLDMKGTSGEESILEYGPGIVRKLRSRYQSLALRQSLGRPTLRRSASLENCLDSASSEPLSSESPSPVPYYEDEVDGDHHGKRSSHPWNRSETNTVLIYNNVTTVVANSNGLVGNRGRSGYNEYSRKDRMRRARSVDALHRPKRHIEEKEILEKLTVVLPKEEIVIIEVSKPQSNISNEINNFNIGIDDKPHLYPRSLHIHTASSVTTTTNGYSGNSSELNRVRSVTSPEHELPPPDIVRETARIFEKNHDPPNNSTSPVNNLLISNVKKVGHALRLSKSSSLSPNSSPLPSPTTASHTNSPTTTNTSMMNGQGGNSYLSQNKGHLSDQGLTTATILNQHQKVKTQDSNQRTSAPTNGATYNSKSAPSSNYSNQHSKQIGVIRPTVTTSNTGAGVTSSSATTTSSVKGIKINSDKTSIKNISICPEVSPIPPNNFAPLISPQTKKPPLGPKPLFTPSPKPTTLLANNKTGSANLTDTPVPNGTNAKSPTEEPVKNNFQSENRMKSPTESFSSGKGIISGNMSNKQNISAMAKPSIEIPKEKENDVMEFQQITLKHVTKQKDRAEVILTNGTSNNNSSSNIPKTTDSSKTENKKKDENSNANMNNRNTKGSSHQPPTATTNPSSTTPAITSVSPIQKVKDAKQDQSRPKQDQQQSLLRAHQKQKLDKQKSSGGETMVFNFTSRKSVPDYIEDDGLHKVKLTLGGTVTDESHDDDELNTSEQVDSRLITFEGANVIINGRSSIQKKPKSQKLNISFNEEAPTTFEYPSEASVLGDDDADNKDNLLGHKTPNITNGSGLGSYTPSKLGNSYQLGNYNDRVVVTKKPLEKKEDNSTELIEDYLKPDTGSTTWSNEIGAADILF
ncbi:unnamed protein product [Allacma fusca]|uniref:Uncharacterized protein n=1 Tax=Allacma fusca TaxID=39272 RepID=A0A8J2KDI3_9HEXA|nr:unnamed protein product [Allacma fusca]